MNIRRYIFEKAVRCMERRFLRRGPESLDSIFLSLDKVQEPDSIDVYTIAFNNAQVIELHNRYVSKYLKGNINHIIIDNSSDPVQAGKIRQVCISAKIPYLRLHKN